MTLFRSDEVDPTAQLILDVTSSSHPTWTGSLGPEQLELAHHHGLLGLLATHSLPHLSQPAQAPYARLAGRQVVMTSHLRRLLSTLHEASVQAAVLKGPYLAHRIYTDNRHRTFTDVDVLVPESQLSTALDVLSGDPAIPRIPLKRPKADKRDLAVRDESGLWFMLDLHWDLFSYSQLRGSADAATDHVWRRSPGPTDHGFGIMSDLPQEARLAFLCTHALLDHRFRMILFRDLAEFAALDPDWEELGRFSTRWGLRSFVYSSLLIAKRVAKADVPSNWLASLRPPSLAIRITEALVPRTDLVRFDGHRPDPLNLALVTLHDRRADRLRLIAHAPTAAPLWLKRFGNLPRRSDRRVRLRGGSAPRVLVLVSSDQRRGAEVFGSQLADGLRDRGWSTELVALSKTDERARIPALTVSGVSPSELGRLDASVVMALRRRVKDWRPDVILANGGATLRYAVASVVTSWRRPKLVYSSIGEPSYWIRGSRHALLQRLLHKRADLVLAVSEETRTQLVQHLGLDDESVVVVPTGVPERLFELPGRAEDGHLRLLFMGNLSAEKNPIAALDVFQRVRSELDARLRFVGTGPLEQRLRRLAADRFSHGIVEFTGSVDDVSPHLVWADLLLLTSVSEGLPGAVLESAAAGVPSISANVGGTREALIDGVTGVLADLEDMPNRIIALGLDSSAREKMGAAAREFAWEKFRMGATLDRYEAILTDLVPGLRTLPLPHSPTPVA